MDLDLLVIGSGSGGQRAAIQAAKLGRRVGVVERRDRIGGVPIHSGTIPSKSLRQSILESMAARGSDLVDPLHPEREGTARVHMLHAWRIPRSPSSGSPRRNSPGPPSPTSPVSPGGASSPRR